MTPLPKHLRPRWRYLAVGFETPRGAAIDRRPFQAACWEAARSLLGDPGSAAADLQVVEFHADEAGGEALVRVRRDAVDPARAALACVTTVDGTPIGLCVRGTSGTIRGATERFLDRG